jgi:gliding motility-associated-like protein
MGFYDLKRLLFTLLLIAGFVMPSHATHIMGGTLTYKYLGGITYLLKLEFYRDCNLGNAAIPASVPCYIKGRSPGSFLNINLLLPAGPSEKLLFPCSDAYCCEKRVFTAIISTGDDPLGYDIWAPASDRNGNILNVSSLNDNGIDWVAFIPSYLYQNSSPALTKDVVPVMCVNKNSTFNAGFYDPDGDSLVYSFAYPYESAWDTINGYYRYGFNFGYSLAMPLGQQTGPVKINPATGEITLTPRTTGNFVLTVDVAEYRVNRLNHRGVYLGSVRTDMQFVVYNCGANPEPVFASDSGMQVRRIDVGQQLCIPVSVQDQVYEGKKDSLKLSASGDLLNNRNNPPSWKDQKGVGDVRYNFCWRPSCADVTNSSPHVVTFRAEDNACNAVEQSYAIYVRPYPYLPPPEIGCQRVIDRHYVQFYWKNRITSGASAFHSYNIYRSSSPTSPFVKVRSLPFISDNTWIDSAAANTPGYLYRYYIRCEHSCGTEGPSSDTFQAINISWLALKPWNGICPHGFGYLTVSDSSFYPFSWLSPKKDASGNPIFLQGRSIQVRDTGYYYLFMDYSASCGALDSTYVGYFPVPDGSAGPDTLLCYNQSYLMQGQGGVSYFWTPATYLSSDSIPDPFAKLPVEQRYTLVVHNKEGCTDSSEVLLKVRPPLRIHISGAPAVSVCYGQEIALQAEPGGGDSDHYAYYWMGSPSSAPILNEKVYQEGWYKLILEDGCSPPVSDSVFIRVSSRPHAAFSIPGKASEANDILFYNESERATHYYWTFGDGQDSREISPLRLYSDSGNYQVRLVAYNRDECSDTAYRFISIKGRFSLYIPNAFSPNSDNINDVFSIEGSDIKDYSLSIYNRWGECVFQSPDGKTSWNGAKDNIGETVQEDVYLYKLKVRDSGGEEHFFSGTVVLIK